MRGRATWRGGWGLLLVGGALLAAPAPGAGQAPIRYDFERGLGSLRVHGEGAAFTAPSGDPEHGDVLVLRPNGDAHVLVPGTDAWPGVRLEGEVLFPTDEHNYLGLVYNLRRSGDRLDFGNVYIKGNGSYLQVNPHRDYNVARLLYPEFAVPLEGEAAIVVGGWQRFKAEVVGRVCHVYVGDMETPRLVFAFLELESGAAGLQPRSVGGDVWVDNLMATPIGALSYAGPPVPAPMEYDPSALLTDWSVLGPLERTLDEVARDPAGGHPWRALATDARGAVVTGAVVDTHGPRTVAYFRTRVPSEEGGRAVLHLSTIDPVALWVNGRFRGFYGPGDRAWPDFWRNPDHRGLRIPVDLRAGENHVVLRVRGGLYAGGGFFARMEPPEG